LGQRQRNACTAASTSAGADASANAAAEAGCPSTKPNESSANKQAGSPLRPHGSKQGWLHRQQGATVGNPERRGEGTGATNWPQASWCIQQASPTDLKWPSPYPEAT